MGKKVDLNAPRDNSGGQNKSRKSHSFSHGRPTTNNLGNNPNDLPSNVQNNDAGNGKKDGLESPTNNNTVQKNGGKLLSKIGAPAAATKLLSGVKTGSLGAKDTIKAIVKFPIKAKLILVAAIFAAPLLALAVFTTTISAADDDSGSTGYASLKHLCSKITVVDTKCDENGENCTRIDDGEITFNDYLAGKIAGITDGVNNLEYYKALAIAVRTTMADEFGDSCSISGSKNYKNIDEAKDKEMIKKAIEETDSLVLTDTDGEQTSTSYCEACVVGKDDNNYYIKYGESSNLQSIPISWSETHYNNRLSTLYQKVDTTIENQQDRPCPTDNSSQGIPLIGALYLADNSQTHKDIVKYYYGEDVKITTAVYAFPDDFIHPLEKVRCTDKYGYRWHPVKGIWKLHTGLDLVGIGNWTIYASRAGTVYTVRKDVSAEGNCAYGYGNYIIIDHGDGFQTLYAHLAYGSIPDEVYKGATVEQGQAIATMGHTGCSTGAHLHFEIQQNHVAVDPVEYMDLSTAAYKEVCGVK